MVRSRVQAATMVLVAGFLVACGGGGGGADDAGVTTPTLQAIEIVVPDTTLPKGLTALVVVNGSYSDGSVKAITPDSWSSSVESVATIDAGGLVTAVDEGDTTISASVGELSDSINFTVAPPVLVSIAITPTDFFLAAGRNQQLTATGTLSDGVVKNVTETVTWSSSDAGRISVSNAAGSKGLATFVGVGAVTLTAADPVSGVQSTVTPPTRNVMFVTSTIGTGNLGSWEEAIAVGATGLGAGDAICQARASAAGLSGEFKAWLSDEHDDAYCRIAGYSGKRAANCGMGSLPDAGPWIRTDGHPFGEALSELAAEDPLAVKHYTPPRFNELGEAASDAEFIFTGTLWDATSGGVIPCGNWTNTGGIAPRVGRIGAGSPNWTYISGNSCGSEHHLLCFQTGTGAELPAFSASGKQVFLTSWSGNADLGSWPAAQGQTGIDAGDAICRKLAADAGVANAANFKAWLSITGTDARDRLVNTSSPYVRLDGVKVADNLAGLVSGSLFTAINLTEKGDTLGGFTAWTGSSSDGTGTASRCDDWTGSSDVMYGSYGLTDGADATWGGYNSMECSAPSRLYCFED